MEKSLIIVLIFAILISVFALGNSEIVEVDFLFTKVNMSQAIVILLSSIIGALAMFLFSGIKQYKLQKENKLLIDNLTRLEEEKLDLEKLLEERMREISKLKE